jgi:hypothetical protein
VRAAVEAGGAGYADGGNAAAGRGRPRARNDRREDDMAISVNLDKILMKEYEGSTPDEVLKAPVTALAGVSDGDAEHLKAAFNIKTVADLAKNKQFKAATLIAGLAEADGR